ncbi:MAG: iron-containing alcohol dehydrogenase [Firmicutes bacterium]|nr:iron-containing alcohol dehydrogenase [Bacillota bacterium]
MVFTLNSTPKIVFGSGASQQTGEKVKELGCKKVLVVHGQFIKKSGIADKVVDTLLKEGIEVVRFEEVEPDPPDVIVERGADLAKKENVDGIIGIGGGSAQDTAKAINVLLGNPSPITRYLDKSIKMNPGKKLILLPTTAGTGSEANSVSVITDTKRGVKGGVIGPPCLPDLAIIDPDFTLGLSPKSTAITGMDTFAHGVESMTTILANPMGDMLAEKVISLVYKYLPIAVKDGSNLEARTNLSFAATIAGMAFENTVLHLGHSIAHSMGAICHISHGIACAIATPYVIEYISDVMPDKIKVMARAMELDVEGKSPEEAGKIVADAVRALSKEIGIPTMKELGIEKDVLEKVAEQATKDDTYPFIPKETPKETILELLHRAYEEA